MAHLLLHAAGDVHDEHHPVVLSLLDAAHCHAVVLWGGRHYTGDDTQRTLYSIPYILLVITASL